MRLDETDISAMDNKTKEDKSSRESKDLDDDTEENLGCNLVGQTYNPNWTLRKCSAKILDRFSVLWAKWTIDNSKSFLELELNNEDWINK